CPPPPPPPLIDHADGRVVRGRWIGARLTGLAWRGLSRLTSSARSCRHAVAFAALCAVAATVVAEPTYHVARSKIESGPWTFTPIYTKENGKVGQVVSFLALADPSTRVGNNLVAVWYQRDGAGWSAKSWETSDPWEAIKSVKGAMGISEDEDDRWGVPGSGFLAAVAKQPITVSKQPITVVERPKKYALGVLATDPFAAAVLASPNKDEVVELLTSVGYAAADVTLEKDDGCTLEAKLDGMALAMVETLKGDEETKVDRSMTAWIASGSAGCGFGSVAVEIYERDPVVITPYGPPATFNCANLGIWPSWYVCLEWTQKCVVLQERTRARFNPTPPPTYQFCDQYRIGTRTLTTECCSSGVIPFSTPPACPPAGVTPPVGVGCTTQPRSWESGITWITSWIPPCPF
ncbi:MAG: hypothetical protein ACK5TP_03420, partial [bacterium]